MFLPKPKPSIEMFYDVEALKNSNVSLWKMLQELSDRIVALEKFLGVEFQSRRVETKYTDAQYKKKGK